MSKFIKNFEEILCGFFLISMITLVIVNVILRFTLSYSIPWAEEVSTICFVWAVFVGASATYKHKMDIGIDMLVLKTPPNVQKVIKNIVTFILLILNGYIFYMSIVFTKIAYMNLQFKLLDHMVSLTQRFCHHKHLSENKVQKTITAKIAPFSHI